MQDLPTLPVDLPKMRRTLGFWRGFAALAMIGFLVVGLSLGRTSCAGTPECCVFGSSAVACISGSAMACGGACFGIEAAGHAGPGPAAPATHQDARIVLGSGQQLQPELRPPRV